MAKIKESDMYKPIKQFFEAQGFDVYEEVSAPYCGGRVDLVANNAPAPIAIEMKVNLSFDLIEQAMRRKNVFPYVYIAIPYNPKRNIPQWLFRQLRAEKVGLLYVETSGRVRIVFAARYHRAPKRHKVKWHELLKPEYQGWIEAGTNGGGYVTPYKITMLGVKNYFKRVHRMEPERWLKISEVLDHCETHYMHPKPSLSKALLEYDNPWLEAKKIGRSWHFRYKEGEQP